MLEINKFTYMENTFCTGTSLRSFSMTSHWVCQLWSPYKRKHWRYWISSKKQVISLTNLPYKNTWHNCICQYWNRGKLLKLLQNYLPTLAR